MLHCRLRHSLSKVPVSVRSLTPLSTGGDVDFASLGSCTERPFTQTRTNQSWSKHDDPSSFDKSFSKRSWSKHDDPSSFDKSSPKRSWSRHDDPSSSDNSSPKQKILLKPHVLSARIKDQCEAGDIDGAIFKLKSSPLDAQNVPVWNTLIWECLKAERYQKAYDVYIDMKRRGHRPNTRTFQTLLSGLSRIDHWENHTKQLQRAHSIYRAFRHHLDEVKMADPSSTELSVKAIANYIKILGMAGLHQEIFDVFYSLDSEGPLAPDLLVFTTTFFALAGKPTEGTSFIQNAASAKLLWNFVQKASKKGNLTIDGRLVASAILALSRGRDVDQAFAFQLAAEYFGLTGPGQPERKGTIPLETKSFAALLQLCHSAEKYGHAIEFFASVLQRPEAKGRESIIDRLHVESVMKALALLKSPEFSAQVLELLEWMMEHEFEGGSKIRPNYLTFELVLTTCWECKDWNSATRTFDLMTGYHCHDFMDGVESEKPRFDERSLGRNIPPTAETLSLMVRTALGSENRAHIRQALRLVSHIGIRSLLDPSGPVSKRAIKACKFYTFKLAEAVLEGIEHLHSQSTPGDEPQDSDIARWKKLQSEAEEIVGQDPDGVSFKGTSGMPQTAQSSTSLKTP